MCNRQRLQGARLSGGIATRDGDATSLDAQNMIHSLIKRGAFSPEQQAVMAKYGRTQSTPSKDFDKADYVLWIEAMGTIKKELVRRGFLEDDT